MNNIEIVQKFNQSSGGLVMDLSTMRVGQVSKEEIDRIEEGAGSTAESHDSIERSNMVFLRDDAEEDLAKMIWVEQTLHGNGLLNDSGKAINFEIVNRVMTPDFKFEYEETMTGWCPYGSFKFVKEMPDKIYFARWICQKRSICYSNGMSVVGRPNQQMSQFLENRKAQTAEENAKRRNELLKVLPGGKNKPAGKKAAAK